MGLQLVADTTYQKILMLIGPPRSGKGVKMRVMRSVVGEANCAGPTLAGLGTNFGLWPLIGKPTAIINDARLDGRTAQALVTERLLSISGEDALDIDRKFMEPLTVKLSCRITIVGNELPRLSDASGALAGRMLLLRLTKSFYGHEDQLLTAKLLEERAGILLWAIAGWDRLRKRGHFVQPDSSKELLEDLQDLVSPIKKFIRERCVFGAQHRASIDELYQGWRGWCESVGRKEPGTEQIFGRDLLAAVPTLRRVRPKKDGERYRAYEGIGLLSR
jgi:putative DNA primase/helicase